MIWVDPVQDYTGRTTLHHKLWCHMASTEGADVPELHEMAAKIGIERERFQGDHYDLPPSKRDLAVQHGAREVSLREMARLVVSRRKAKKSTI